MSAYTQYDFGIYSPKDRDRFSKERATFLGGCWSSESCDLNSHCSGPANSMV